MNISCTPGGGVLIPLTNSCLCNAPYYGSQCEFVYSWWFPLNTFNHVFEGVILLIILGWAIAVTVVKCKQRKNRGQGLTSLAGAGLILAIVASLARYIFLVAPGAELVPFSTNPVIVIVVAVALPISIVLWLAATSLITAFWYEIWTKKTRASGTIAKGTKIFLITASTAFFVLAVVGLVYLEAAAPLGFLVYYIPLGVIIVSLIGFTIRLSLFDTSKISHSLKAKHSWTTRLFIASCINWVIYYITLGAFIFYGNDPASMLGYILFRTTESVAAVINMCLLDYKVTILRCKGDVKASRWSTTTTPSNPSGSGVPSSSSQGSKSTGGTEGTGVSDTKESTQSDSNETES